MIIQCGLTELRPGVDWWIGDASVGLPGIYISPTTVSRFFSWTDAYKACLAAAMVFGFEFDSRGFVINWCCVPNAAACQYLPPHRRR